jgi:spore maturation protein CgeB
MNSTPIPKIVLPDSKGQRMILVGDYMWPWYQDACADALESMGFDVERFGWPNDFHSFVEGKTGPVYLSLWHRIQYRFHFGPTVWQVNQRLIQVAKQFEPEIVWFYNVQLISSRTVKKLRKLLPNTIFIQYANDNPFSNDAKHGLWRNYLSSIPHFDVHFAYRHSNILNYRLHGVHNVHLLRSYFIPEEDHPELQKVIPDRFKCDIVFAGHYEDDGRVELLEAICEAGYALNLFGGGWNVALKKISTQSPLHGLFPVAPVTGAEYRYAICGAKVALSFLSTLNHDTYTRRNFQIPAMKVSMLSQYTDDLASLFIPDIEATFFRNKAELLQKLKALIADEKRLSAIAEAGFKRVHNDGHDVNARMRSMVDIAFQSTFEK